MNSETQTLITTSIVLLVIALPTLRNLIKQFLRAKRHSRATHRREKIHVTRIINRIKAANANQATPRVRSRRRQKDG